MNYEVIRDPLEPKETWRVTAGDYFTLPKFGSAEEADAYAGKLSSGLLQPEFGDRPVRVLRDAVLDLGDAVLVRTQVEHEAFTFTTILGETFTWDITRARDHVQRGDVVGLDEIPRGVLAEIAASNDWQQDVVDKADPSKHGIAAPIVALGEVIYILVDGTHRAVRALQQGQPFSAWLLTPEANRACLVRCEGRVP
jgi:hypothetical protein